MKILFAAVMLALSVLASAADFSLYTTVVHSLTIDGKRIDRGMTHDDFVAKVGFTPISITNDPDPVLRGSMHVFEQFLQDKHQFLVEFKRQRSAGPYVVYRIRLPSS